MPVVLDSDTGERVLLYGADGSTLRKLVVDSSGRLTVVGIGSGGAVEVIQDTPADLKTAVHGLDGSTQRQLKVDSSGRLMPTDVRERNPLLSAKAYAAATVAPHAGTERWTYTVPAARWALVESLQALMLRDAVATAVARSTIILRYAPADGGTFDILRLELMKNAVGDDVSALSGLNLLLETGDTLSARTSDGSTGGTVFYQVAVKLTEFDV